MRLGQLAARSAVSVQTIRYYERRGLLKKPRRLASDYGDYSPESAAIVTFIKRSQESGLTLKEIGTILRLLNPFHERVLVQFLHAAGQLAGQLFQLVFPSGASRT